MPDRQRVVVVNVGVGAGHLGSKLHSAGPVALFLPNMSNHKGE